MQAVLFAATPGPTKKQPKLPRGRNCGMCCFPKPPSGPLRRRHCKVAAVDRWRKVRFSPFAATQVATPGFTRNAVTESKTLTRATDSTTVIDDILLARSELT